MKIASGAVFCQLYLCFNFVGAIVFDTDKPCAAQHVPGQSVLCVCNVTYCDTITRIKPDFGSYVAYTSSEDGLRFRKTFGAVLSSFKIPYARILHAAILELHPFTLYQEITGFGGAVTDSTGLNWKTLEDPRLKQHLVNSYCSKLGLEYNMLRIPMGGTDFSTRLYTYDDAPDDCMLSNFNLAPEDKEYKIPLIKDCLEVATSPVKIVASISSPPAWMKTSHSLIGGYLKQDHYQTLANYFVKFLEKYNEYCIPVWAVTTTNEPLASIIIDFPTNKLDWTVTEMGRWLVNNLGPTLRNSTFCDVKILGCDDMRFTIPLWFNSLVGQYPSALEYLYGVAIHSYYDDITPASQITVALESYPDIVVLNTESCKSFLSTGNFVLGSWSRAANYADDIIDDLNHRVSGWIDWNMCLNEEGGPAWNKLIVDSPIIVLADKQKFYKQPMFYAMGHFSKFVPRGSRRMKVTEIGGLDVQNVAFLTPQGTIVVVLSNKGKRRDIVLRIGPQIAIVDLEPKSITTVEFQFQYRL